LRFLELNEIEEWCGEHGIEVADTGPCPDPHLSHLARVTYASGQRSGREAAVARVCVQALGEWDECLLWITLTGVWPSGEDWPAYYAMRGERGERRALDVAPGHAFRPGETEPLTQFLTAVMENGWDAYVLPVRWDGETAVRLRISHDEYVELQSRRSVQFDALAV
jgi:hypothetical protein